MDTVWYVQSLPAYGSYLMTFLHMSLVPRAAELDMRLLCGMRCGGVGWGGVGELIVDGSGGGWGWGGHP